MDVDKTLKNIRNSISDIDTCLPKVNFDVNASDENLRVRKLSKKKIIMMIFF